MGRRKPRKTQAVKNTETAMETEPSRSPLAEQETLKCEPHDYEWDVSEGNCICNQTCLLDSLADQDRLDEGSSVRTDSPSKLSSAGAMESPSKLSSIGTDSPAKASSLGFDSPCKLYSLSMTTPTKFSRGWPESPSKASSLGSDSTPGKLFSVGTDSPGRLSSVDKDSPGSKLCKLGTGTRVPGKLSRLWRGSPSKCSQGWANSPNKDRSVGSVTPSKLLSAEQDSPHKSVPSDCSFPVLGQEVAHPVMTQATTTLPQPCSPVTHQASFTTQQEAGSLPKSPKKRGGRGYNLRSRKCLSVGSQQQSPAIQRSSKASGPDHFNQGDDVPATTNSNSMLLSLKAMHQQSAERTATSPDLSKVKREVEEEERGCSSPPKQTRTAFPKELYPSCHVTQEEFLKVCDLVKTHSMVYVKQELEPLDLDLECQIVRVDRPMPVPHHMSPNTRLLIASIKREGSDSPTKARKSLDFSGGCQASEDSDAGSDVVDSTNTGGRSSSSSVKDSLLCIPLTSPLGQRVKKFTRADLVKLPLSDFERYCISIPEEDELRHRLRQIAGKDLFPIKFRRRKAMSVDHCHTYKFSFAQLRHRIWRLYEPEMRARNQEQPYLIKKSVIHLTRMNEDQIRIKTQRKKTILNRELEIDSDISIVRMDVPEKLFQQITKMADIDPQDLPESVEADSGSPVPGPSGVVAMRTSSTGVCKGLPQHLRPCPKSKRKLKKLLSIQRGDEKKDVDVESLLPSSDDEDSVKKQTAKSGDCQPEGDDVQIVSVTQTQGLASSQSGIHLSEAEDQAGATAARQTRPPSGHCVAQAREAPTSSSRGALVRSEAPSMMQDSTAVDVTSTVTEATSCSLASASAVPCSSVSAFPVPAQNLHPHNPAVQETRSPGTPNTVNPVTSKPHIPVQSPHAGAQNQLDPTVQNPHHSGSQNPQNPVNFCNPGPQNPQLYGVESSGSGTPNSCTPDQNQHNPAVQNPFNLGPHNSQLSGLQSPHNPVQNPLMSGSRTVPVNPCPVEGASDPGVPQSYPSMQAGMQSRAGTAVLPPAMSGGPQVWPGSAAQCVSVMSTSSSVQAAPLPVISPQLYNPPAAAQGTSGNEFMGGGNLPGQHYPQVPSNFSGMNTAISQSSQVPSTLNTPGGPTNPALQPLTSSSPFLPPVYNFESGSGSFGTGSGSFSMGSAFTASAIVSSSANMTLVTTDAGGQSSVLNMFPNGNPMQGQPVFPADGGGVMHNSSQPAGGVSTGSFMGAPSQQQSNTMLGPSSQIPPTPTNLFPSQSTQQVAQFPTHGQGCYVQNNSNMQNNEQIFNNPHGPAQSSFYPQSSFQTLEAQNPAHLQQGNMQMASLPQPQGSIYTPGLQPNLQANLQGPVPQNSSFGQGSLQPSDSTYLPGSQQSGLPPVQGNNLQTNNMPPDSPFMQGGVQMMPQNSAYGQSQTMMARNAVSTQGRVQDPQNLPFVQQYGNSQSYTPQGSFSVLSSVPQNSFVGQSSVPQNSFAGQTSVSQNAFTGQNSMPQNTFTGQTMPQNSFAGQTFVPENTFNVPGSVQTTMTQNSPFGPGSFQTSTAQNPSYFAGNNQSSFAQNSSIAQGNYQTSMAQSLFPAQDSTQVSVQQNMPGQQGYDQMPMPQNSPFVPGSMQTSGPQSSQYGQGNVVTPGPQNSTPVQGQAFTPHFQGTAQSSMSQTSVQGNNQMPVLPYFQGQVPPQMSQGPSQMSVTQNSGYRPGNNQTSLPHFPVPASLPQNPPYALGNVQTSVASSHLQTSAQTVPANSIRVQDSVSSSMPPNSAYLPGSTQSAAVQNSPLVQGNVKTTVPQNSSYTQVGAQPSVATSMPHSPSLVVQGTVQTPVSQSTAFTQGVGQTSAQSVGLSAPQSEQSISQSTACSHTSTQQPGSTFSPTTPFSQGQSMSGPPQNMAAPPSQNVPGPLSQNIAGPSSQNVSGPLSQNMAGYSSQNMGGVQSQNVSDVLSENVAVPVSQNVPGSSSHHTAGVPCQNVPGTSSQNAATPISQNVSSPPSQNSAVGVQSQKEAAISSQNMGGDPALNVPASLPQNTTGSHPAGFTGGGNQSIRNLPTPTPSVGQSSSVPVSSSAPQPQSSPAVDVDACGMQQVHNLTSPAVSESQVSGVHTSSSPGVGAQTSPPSQATVHLAGGNGGVTSVGTNTGTTQSSQTLPTDRDTESRSVIIVNDDDTNDTNQEEEEMKKKMSVFNLIPKRPPVSSSSTQQPPPQSVAAAGNQTTPTPTQMQAAGTDDGTPQLRISAVFGANELASMFEVANNSFQVCAQSGQPAAQQPTLPAQQPAQQPTQQPTHTVGVGTTVDLTETDLQIGAVYGASELANNQLASSLGLGRGAPHPPYMRGRGQERPQVPYMGGRGQRFQARYQAPYTYRPRQSRYDYRMRAPAPQQQQQANFANMQRFSQHQTYMPAPRQRFPSAVNQQQNVYRGRGGGGAPQNTAGVYYGRGQPATRRGRPPRTVQPPPPSRHQHMPMAQLGYDYDLGDFDAEYDDYDDDDCVEVICLDDD